MAFSLLLLDIDFFKKINDSHGHEAGDHALKAMSAWLTDNVRGTDHVFRYGGEEFCLLLSHSTPQAARQAAEHVRRIVETSSFEEAGETLSFTTSIGVASFPQDGADLQALLGAADKRLYAAKLGGRNRVVWE